MAGHLASHSGTIGHYQLRHIVTEDRIIPKTEEVRFRNTATIALLIFAPLIGLAYIFIVPVLSCFAFAYSLVKRILRRPKFKN